jgi:hypothetical protein
MTRDINLVDRFCATASSKAQRDLAIAVSQMTKNGLQDGFEIEDIIACLAYMVEAEAEVAADVYDSEQYDKRSGIKKD